MWTWLPVIAWVVLLIAWGRFWLADQRLGACPALAAWPEVAVVIPARDEAETIAAVVRAHGARDYPGHVRIFVVDDASSDGTGALAAEAGAEVVAAPPLAKGWSGKLWAVQAGLAAARAAMPDVRWVLLTDADIQHAPGTLRALVAKGEAEGLALVSLMARLDMRGFWGGLLIPAFVFFFQKLYPFPWVNRPGHWCAAAAGGCVLIRAEALAAIGGIAAIRGALIDDCALAAAVKRTGRAVWLGLAADEAVSLRDNRGFGSIWQMVARTAYTQLGHSPAMLTGAVAGMALLYAAPVGLSVWGGLAQDAQMAASGAVAWALMWAAYAPTLRHYGRAWWQGLALPLAAVLYTAMTVGSAVRHWRGAGGRWKGRTYP